MSRPTRTRPVLALAITILALGACAPPAPDTAADLAAIAELRARFQAAENAGDPGALMETVAGDIIILAPNSPAIEGATAVEAHFREEFEQVTLTLRYQGVETVASGNWGFDRGSYQVTVTPKAGGETTTSRGKYLWVARREADGAWKYARIIWNGDGNAAAGGS